MKIKSIKENTSKPLAKQLEMDYKDLKISFAMAAGFGLLFFFMYGFFFSFIGIIIGAIVGGTIAGIKSEYKLKNAKKH